MSITFQRKGVRYQEVWFDEPVAPGQDIIIGYQRPQCPSGVKGRPFHTLAPRTATIDRTTSCGSGQRCALRD